MKKATSTSKTTQNPLRKRSLSEVDDVIQKIIDRNPDFVIELEKYIEKQLKDPNVISRRPRSR